jgi:hypothetical protein
MEIKKSIGNFVKKYKKKMIYVGIASIIGYFLYKRFLSEKVNFAREVYSKMSTFHEMFKMNSNYENISQQFEKSFDKLVSKLLEEIKQKIDSEFNLNALFERIKSAQSQQRDEYLRLWNLFKCQTYIALICSIFITRCLILLSQTHLLILEKSNLHADKLPNTFFEDLLTDLWIPAKNFIVYMTKYIENKLNPLVENIPLNQLLTQKQVDEYIIKLREKVEEVFINDNNIYLIIFQNYFMEIEKKIENLENKEFTNDIKGVSINAFLKFYQIYYDVITSNLFQIMLIKALDNDYALIQEVIGLNFEEEMKKNNNQIDTVSGVKIVNFVNTIRKQNLEFENTIFLKKDYYKNNQFFEELNEYFKIIYD